MTFNNIATLLGGLAMFIFGMNLMSSGLKDMAGGYLKKILEKLTEKRITAVLVGAGLTAIIQSSNAMCGMAVGFVNAGLMQLERSVGIVMGAKIGTTITGQLIAFHISDYAPIIAFVGVAIFMFGKNKIQYLGQVIASLGILFIGLGFMGDAMEPFKELQWFQDLMSNLQNPILAVLVGVVFTTIMQSASASVGVLQMMMLSGIISFEPAFFVMMGMNIGSSIAPILASIGGRKDAKRVAAIVLLMESIGMLVFLITSQFLPILDLIKSTSMDPSRQIANANTLFSVVTVIVLFPFANYLAKLSRIIVPGTDEKEKESTFEFINEAGYKDPRVLSEQIDAEVRRMEKLVKSNLKASTGAFFNTNDLDVEKFRSSEATIDFLNKGITDALVKISSMPLTDKEAKHVANLFHVINDLERIGDHAENMLGYALKMKDEHSKFSPEALIELKELVTMTIHILDDACVHLFDPSQEAYNNIFVQENNIDNQVDDMKIAHIDRLNENTCESSQGLMYVETLTDLERISDHALNIAQAAKVRYHYNGTPLERVNS
ncbi:MAG: Na/Pi cotransporter family protein [Oscillospiraceae bacterium]|nr:Na/Pi cotransporter family protein [Oscillospiraceae bacterium]